MELIHTTIYKIDNQQRPTVEHREVHSIITYKGKESEKEWIFFFARTDKFISAVKLWKTGFNVQQSLCYIPETSNTVNKL